jgi:hypothetical protein
MRCSPRYGRYLRPTEHASHFLYPPARKSGTISHGENLKQGLSKEALPGTAQRREITTFPEFEYICTNDLEERSYAPPETRTLPTMKMCYSNKSKSDRIVKVEIPQQLSS